MKPLWALTATLALAACGNMGGNDIGRRLSSTLFDRGEAARPVETPGFTGQAIADRPQDFMIVEVPSMGLAEPARIIRDNGSEETWQAQGGFTFAMDDGMLVATRGLIDDLMVTDGSQTRAAIRAGGGTVTRRTEVMDSLDQLSTLTFTCTVTANGSEAVNLGLREVTLRKFTESCTNDRITFENAYWLDANGAIISSRQLVSTTVAYLRSNRL